MKKHASRGICVQEKCIPGKHISLYDIASDPWPQGVVAIKIVPKAGYDPGWWGVFYGMEWK